MEKFTPPTISEATDNALKTADSFEKKPMATAFGIVVFVLIAFNIYQAYQINKLTEANQAMLMKLFDKNFIIEKQSTVIDVQSEAINKTSEKIDSTMTNNNER